MLSDAVSHESHSLTGIATADRGNAAEHRERAYALPVALRDTLSKLDMHFGLRLNYVEDFHAALDHLRDAGEDVEEFRIRADRIRQPLPP